VPLLPEDAWFLKNLTAERFTVSKAELDELLAILVAGDDEARETAAQSLGSHGSDAVERLAYLLSDDSADARWWAVRALAETKEEGAIPPLIDALGDDDPDVRACAALALGRMGLSDAPADTITRATAVLASCLADQSAFVASVAADGLTMIGEPAVSALADMLTEGQPHARLLAVRALARIKSLEAIGPLFGALDDSSYLVRYYAQEALEALGVGMVLSKP
jgi:HEAT repeat protein